MRFLRTRHHSRILSALCTVALVGGGFSLGAPYAQAADTDIVVEPAADNPIASFDGTSEVLNKQLLRYGQATLSFVWRVPSANKTNFTSGDKFTINLGDFFVNKEYGPQKRVPLFVPTGETQTQIGECAFTAKEIVCTFNANVDRLKTSYDQFGGELKLHVWIQKSTTEETVPIKIQDSVVNIVLPKGPPNDTNTGVGIGNSKTVDAAVYKSLLQAEHSKENSYSIYMSGKRLKEHFEKAGAAFALGDPNTTITFLDTLVNEQGQVDHAHTFKTKPHPTDANKLVPADETSWKFYSHRLNPESRNLLLEDLTDGPNSALTPQQSAEYAALNPGQFEMKVEFAKAHPEQAIITVKGPFKENFNYSIHYRTAVTNPAGVQVGSVFSNKLELSGTARKFQLDKAYRSNVEANAHAIPSFGYFKVDKTLAFTSVTVENLIKAHHTVTVNYRYELPLPADMFANWEAPGTLEADKIHGTASCVINFRTTNLCLDKDGKAKLLPINSKVYITPEGEDLSTISEDIRNLTWETPKVSVSGGAEYGLISDQANRIPLFTITNKATKSEEATFSVEKVVSGVKPGVTPPHFAFKYVCTPPGGKAEEGWIRQVVAGASAKGVRKNFPVGTSCTVTEVIDETSGISGYTLTAPPAQTVVLNKANESVKLTFTNAYKETPPPGKKVPPSTIAKTGADTGTLTFAAALMLGAGAITLRRHRK